MIIAEIVIMLCSHGVTHQIIKLISPPSNFQNSCYEKATIQRLDVVLDTIGMLYKQGAWTCEIGSGEEQATAQVELYVAMEPEVRRYEYHFGKPRISFLLVLPSLLELG